MPVERTSGAPGLREAEGGVCAPRGFTAAGVHCGLKRQRRDLALIVSEVPTRAAGTFTKNRVQAAPLQVTREHLQAGPLRAIVCNSGNANACNGARGLADARRMAELAAEALGVAPREVAVASTGVIGLPLDMEKVAAGIREAAAALSPQGGGAAAEGIMTTDTRPKEVAVRFSLGGRTAFLGGIAKGSGMIHPNMATLLSFLTTDAAVEADVLAACLRRAVDRSFNMVTVDGDTSTNDMVLCLANGLAGNPPVAGEGPARDAFQQALDHVCVRLAREIARDGEGATRLIEVRVRGAASEEDARRVARAVASSSLVKTAVFGQDANWGRIVCAAGYAGARLDPERLDVWIGDLPVARDGAGLVFDEEEARARLSRPEVVLALDLKLGPGRATAWTCDLTYDYVKINASYRS